MRNHGRASISQTSPRALAVCDRCGFLYNHSDLAWQHQWRGTKIQNIRILVCDSCLDIPQEQLRTIIIPMDPAPIMNARQEDYVNADNPMSAVGANPNFFKPSYGSRIGNLTGGGGINAAFDGNASKPAWMSATNASVSNSSYNNYVGINWSGINYPANITLTSSIAPPVIRHSLTSFTITAPNDRSFLGTTATNYLIQSSPTNTHIYGAWTTVSSGTTAGTAGETITGACTGGNTQFHRVAFLGDQTNYVSVAQVKFNVAQTGNIATGGSS